MTEPISEQQKAQAGELIWFQGNLMAVKASRSDTAGALDLLEATFHEGHAPPLHIHHAEDEAFYVLEGRIRFRRGDTEFVAGAGDFVWNPRGVPHAFKVEDGPARALVLTTPSGFVQFVAEVGEPAQAPRLPDDHRYDTDKLMALADKYGLEVVGEPLD